jgi:hypothetical protein
MTNFRLILCCLSAYYCVFAYAAQADGMRSNEHNAIERGELANVRQGKFAGRANNASEVNGQPNKGANSANAQYPIYSKDAPQKKPLSREERLALRRQINETETMYPKRAN